MAIRRVREHGLFLGGGFTCSLIHLFSGLPGTGVCQSCCDSRQTMNRTDPLPALLGLLGCWGHTEEHKPPGREAT